MERCQEDCGKTRHGHVFCEIGFAFFLYHVD